VAYRSLVKDDDLDNHQDTPPSSFMPVHNFQM